jgi:hypothetical protein
MKTPRFLALALILSALAAPAPAVDFIITYQDGASEGFNDATLGSQRRAALEFAVDIWSQILDGDVTIRVLAKFDPLGGDANSATLGFASPVSNHLNISGGVANTVYPAAIGNQIAGTDLNAGSAEISCTFNTDVDGPVVLGSQSFYYGLDAGGGGSSNFVTIALHEIGHGLGFLDNFNQNGSYASMGQPNIFDRQLVRPGVGNVVAQPQATRATLLISTALFFQGPAVLAERPPNGGRIYAPSTFEPGSSIAHWDLSLTPNQLMEPTYNTPIIDPDLELPAFEDMGYQLLGPPMPAETDWNLYE